MHTRYTDEKHLCADAVIVQDACNLAGVLGAMRDGAIFLDRAGLDTDAIRAHPAMRAFADKVAHLTGTQNDLDAVLQAHTDVQRLMDTGTLTTEDSRPSLLAWKSYGGYREAILGDFEGGDGARFYLEHVPTCYRRGQYKLFVEVAQGKRHHWWGCFDAADQPLRWYHDEAAARSEAQHIADVLWTDRLKRGPAPGEAS